jgi:uncharacterized protein YegP (UPF0339 family)
MAISENKREKNPRFEHYLSADGDWRWRLIAKNGEIIASGEGYGTLQAVKRGTSAVRRAVGLIERREAAEHLCRLTKISDVRKKKSR